MQISGALVVSLLVALIAVTLALTLKNWIARLLLFLVALGASSIATANLGLDAAWSGLISIVLFIVVGVTAIRHRDLGSRILGIILIIIGLVLILPSVEALGAATPGTIWEAIVSSFQRGLVAFNDSIRRAFGGT